jgi:selenocysteine lyase/cysteine desulfurase
MSELEKYFSKFREQIVGIDTTYQSPYGEQRIIYGDWIASGRLYRPIEDKLVNTFGPFVANTHTETSETGTLMTHSYHHAQRMIKEAVNAGPDDVFIQAGFGMTAVINKLQRILGLKTCGVINRHKCQQDKEKPVVFLTHMEHHSNHTSWYETNTDVVLLEPDENLLVDPEQLRKELEKYKDRKFKIGSFTAGSNVTGVRPDYYALARVMHEYNGLCFVDFAATAPYDEIDMHPADPMEKLDAIFFSPHKFLGGPGTAGIMVFDSNLYTNQVPDNPGGGTVDWTNRWGEYKYIDDIEAREDGGTPGFLQAIKTSFAFQLKDQMGVDKIRQREHELVSRAIDGLEAIPGIEVLAKNQRDRIGAISFYHPEIHYNLFVKLLSDRYGIQVRGGCACAGTYGHWLLDVSHQDSNLITNLINHGDLSRKPGWIRWSLHPTTTNNEVDLFLTAAEDIAKNHDKWIEDYFYDRHTNEFVHHSMKGKQHHQLLDWFKLD